MPKIKGQISSRPRYVIAFLLAPLLPAFLSNLLWIAMLVAGTGNTTNFAFILVLSLLLSYGVAMLFGVPALWLLEAFNRVSIVSISACGLLLGPLAWMVVELVVRMLLGSGTEFDFSVFGLFFGAVLGFGTALLFSIIAGVSITSAQPR